MATTRLTLGNDASTLLDTSGRTLTHSAPRGPASRTPAEPAAERLRDDPSAADLLLPLAAGFLGPRAEDLIRGQSYTRLSVANMSANWRGGTTDFTFAGQDPKRDIFMHGTAGAVLGYLPLRSKGFSPAVSSAGAALLGMGIELGQSLEPGHRTSYGDIARTTFYGTLFGEGLYQAHLWARERYDVTGNALYKAMALIANPANTNIGIGSDGVQVGFRFTF